MFSLSRRKFLASACVVTAVTACGGGGVEVIGPAPTYQDPITPDNYIDVRRSEHVGGSRGWVCANRWVKTIVGPDVTNFEWNLVGILENNAKEGENCASYFQAQARNTGSTWAGVFEVGDRSMGKNPNVVALEVDVWAPGRAGRDNRLGIHIVAGPPPEEFRNGATEFGADEGIRISGAPARDGSYWRKGVLLEGITEVLLDAEKSPGVPVVAVSELDSRPPGGYLGKLPIRVGGRVVYLPVYE